MVALRRQFLPAKLSSPKQRPAPMVMLDKGLKRCFYELSERKKYSERAHFNLTLKN